MSSVRSIKSRSVVRSFWGRYYGRRDRQEGRQGRRLELTEEEVKQFATDLEDILQYFSILDEAPELSEFDFNPVKVEKSSQGGLGPQLP